MSRLLVTEDAIRNAVVAEALKDLGYQGPVGGWNKWGAWYGPGWQNASPWRLGGRVTSVVKLSARCLRKATSPRESFGQGLQARSQMTHRPHLARLNGGAIHVEGD